MSDLFESEFTYPNLLQGIQDQQSVPQADILAGFAAIDKAISSSQGSYEIGDDPTQIGAVAFHDEGRLVIASHKIAAPNEAIPGAPIAQTGGVIAYDLRRHESRNSALKDQDGWSLYLPEQERNGNLGNGRSWEQRAGQRREVAFAVSRLIGTLEMAQQFGEVVSEDEAYHLLHKRY